MTYIFGQTVITICWIVLNLVAFVAHWDPYPFILLNLAFSIQAAYASPLILLAQRRQSQRDSERAQHDFEVDTETLALVKEIHAHMKGNS